MAPLQYPRVRDLAWALGSPPLLQPDDPDGHWPDAEWFRALFEGSAAWFQALDRDPAPLEAWLAQGSGRRLGGYFESLWGFWLSHSPDYTVLQHNLPVRASGRTLGEFDLLVREEGTQRVLHWELAVKFYLGQPPTEDPMRWIGPGGQDRLGHKLQRLLGHQTRLCQLDPARHLLRELGLEVAASFALIKGRLFYPLEWPANPPRGSGLDHLRGWWSTQRGFLNRFGSATLRWFRLPKSSWLAPLHSPEGVDGLSPCALLESMAADSVPEPWCVAGLQARQEQTRGFIVPETWPQQANRDGSS